MRKGFNPAMLLDSKGRLFCIATGSDACSEHENGSAELMLELTGEPTPQRETVATQLRVGALKKTPDLMASRYIVRDLERVEHLEREVAGEQEAVLAYSTRGLVNPFGEGYSARELSFPSFSKPNDMAGAWDESSFGFKVRGVKKVAQLRDFAAAMKDGKVMFAGTFLKQDDTDRRLCGVILARSDMIRPEHRAAMKVAQEEFESDVQLHLKARTYELRSLSNPLHGRITHIWPVWKNHVVGGEVAYALNPGNADATYFGPYGFEQLRDWLKAGASTPLRPVA